MLAKGIPAVGWSWVGTARGGLREVRMELGVREWGTWAGRKEGAIEEASK